MVCVLGKEINKMFKFNHIDTIMCKMAEIMTQISIEEPGR